MPYTVKSGDNLWSIWRAHGGGMSWTNFKKLNAHLGNLDLIHPGDAIKLPGDAAAPAPSAPAASAAGATPSGVPEGPSMPMDLEPGAYLALLEEQMELERQWREREAGIAEIAAENQARALELQLASSPIDFVAYQLYKREREGAGQEVYSGPSATDEDIQEMVRSFSGAEEPAMSSATRQAVGSSGRGIAALPTDSLGFGAFGVDIPRTESISRQEARGISPQEMDILGSFLRAGFEANGSRVSYNPEDYWREVEEGFIPTIQSGKTRYAF